MTKPAMLSAELLLGLLQQIAILQAIVVERNLHTYYKLPVDTAAAPKGHQSNGTQEYYILQCPYRATTDIPRPRDMQVCVRVDKYVEQGKSGKMRTTAKPKVRLTQVEYIPDGRPEAEEKRPRPKTPVPKTPRPLVVRMRQARVKERLRQPHVKRARKRRPRKEAKYPDAHSVEAARAENFSIDYENDFDDNEFDDDDEKTKLHRVEDDEPDVSPLKYLSVKDALDKLTSSKFPQIHGDLRRNVETEGFYADLAKYRRGQMTKGYHNLFHRDEMYKDHIFYDDLDQQGRLGHRGRGVQSIGI